MGILDVIFGNKPARFNQPLAVDNAIPADFEETITVDPDKPLLSHQSRPSVIFENGLS